MMRSPNPPNRILSPKKNSQAKPIRHSAEIGISLSQAVSIHYLHSIMKYRPLSDPSEDFRIIVLKSIHHVKNNSFIYEGVHIEIQCVFQTASHKNRPPYFALSYMWGEKFPGEIYPAVPILLDGDVWQVTRSLASALLCLRQDNSDVYVWADALCINQSDDEEKGSQIRRMRDIYAHASKTKVWLGENEANERIMQSMYAVGTLAIDSGLFDAMKMMRKAREAGQKLEQETYHERINGLVTELMKTSEVQQFPLVDFRKFSEIPYWSRVWILQEVAVSSETDFMNGESPVHLPILLFRATTALVTALIPRSNKASGAAFSVADAISVFIGWKNFSALPIGLSKEYNQIPKRTRNLLQLLSAAHTSFVAKPWVHTEATEPKDRVFALLGLAEDFALFQDALVYSMTVEEVYRQTASIIISNGGVDLLVYCQPCHTSEDEPKTRNSLLPTWVPDWNTQILHPCNGLPFESPFCASGPIDTTSYFPPPKILDHNLNHLQLRGLIVDTIELAGTPCTPEKHQDSDLGRMHTYFEEIRLGCTESDRRLEESGFDIYTDPSARAAAPYLVPIADRPGNLDGNHFKDSKSAWKKGHTEWKQLIQSAIEGNIQQTTSSAEAIAYIGAMRDMHSRRAFLSKLGYVGLAPQTMVLGDAICIFAEAKFPYIIRKFPGDNQLFSLVGEAYVHGIMYGEFFQRGEFQTKPEWDWVDVTLV
jgi:hypothetical protein